VEEKKQLIAQFLTESLLINLIAISLAFILVIFAQSSFNKLLQNEMSLSYLLSKGMNGYSIIILFSAVIITGIFVSAFYPALVLSSFAPITVLKGKLSTSKKGIVFRKGLVIAQFSITVILIICSLIVLRQLKFMNSKDLGFNLDQVLIIQPPALTNFDSTFISRVNTFKEDVKKNQPC
jgi:putative ABC transport system permease protein